VTLCCCCRCHCCTVVSPLIFSCVLTTVFINKSINEYEWMLHRHLILLNNSNLSTSLSLLSVSSRRQQLFTLNFVCWLIHRSTSAWMIYYPREGSVMCHVTSLYFEKCDNIQSTLQDRDISGVFNAYQNLPNLPRHSPTFLIWNNLFDLIYQQPTRNYRSQTAVA